MQKEEVYSDDANEAEWPTGEEENLDIQEEEDEMVPLKEAKGHKKAKKEEVRTEHIEHKKAKKEHKETHESASEGSPSGGKGFWGSTKVWKISAAVVLLLLVVSIFTSGFRSFGGGISENEAVSKALTFINENMLKQQGVTAVVQSSEDVGELYKLNLNVGGQAFETYISKDANYFFPQGFDISGTEAAATVPIGSGAAKVDLKLNGDDVVIGNTDAPVTIIEYSDPSCPFCAAAAGASEMVAYMKSRDPTYEPALPGIMKEYVETGKARFVFRYFPGHGKGVDAMQIMFCSNEQGKFWKLHDIMFENQALMESGNVAGLKKLATDLGMDSAKLEACLASRKYDAKLAADTASGRAAGVSGTPGFFVNGRVVSGAASFSTFVPLIEAELAASDNKEVTGNAVAAPAEVQETEVTVTAKKYRFDPVEVNVAKGSLVKLQVKSVDVDFNVVVPDFGVELDLTPGETSNAEFVAENAGEYTFTCSNCEGKEAVMKGKIVVQ